MLLIVGVWVGSTRRAGVILVSDFVATYVGLEIVTSDDPSALYDLDRQIGLQRDIYPEIEDGAAYMNPPFYLAPLLPLAALSFDQAMFVVAVLNTALIVWWARTA